MENNTKSVIQILVTVTICISSLIWSSTTAYVYGRFSASDQVKLIQAETESESSKVAQCTATGGVPFYAYDTHKYINCTYSDKK